MSEQAPKIDPNLGSGRIYYDKESKTIKSEAPPRERISQLEADLAAAKAEAKMWMNRALWPLWVRCTLCGKKWTQSEAGCDCLTKENNRLRDKIETDLAAARAELATEREQHDITRQFADREHEKYIAAEKKIEQCESELIQAQKREMQNIGEIDGLREALQTAVSLLENYATNHPEIERLAALLSEGT